MLYVVLESLGVGETDIRGRLRVSNLLMIVVPVAISLLVGAGVIAAVWYALARGAGIGVDDAEDARGQG